MESLWPKEILGSKKWQLQEILSSQAQALAKGTDGALRAAVKERIEENLFTMSFTIYARGRIDYSYELFRVKVLNGVYPAKIEVYHFFSEEKRHQTVNNDEELTKVLRTVFHAEETRRILKSIAEIALAEKTPQNFGTENVLISRDLIADSGGGAWVVFFGVSTFISISELKRLSSDPGQENSAYAKLGEGSFVTTVNVKAPLKMTLDERDVLTLKKAAQQILLNEKK